MRFTTIRHFVSRFRVVAALVIFSLFVTSTRAGTVQLFDGTFNDSDWTSARIDSTRGFSAGQSTTGGNPGDYRFIHVFVAQDGPVITNLGSNLIFTPGAQGAPMTIDYSMDTETTNAAGGTYFLLLSQGGVLYADGAMGVNSTSNNWFHSARTGRASSDFGRVDGNAGHPDFSASGGPIEFGYLGTFGGGGFFESDTGIDNLSISIHAVPEPSALLLSVCGVSAVGLSWLLRRCGAVPKPMFTELAIGPSSERMKTNL